jgi:DNA-binding NarL/FixJ family response regulator
VKPTEPATATNGAGHTKTRLLLALDATMSSDGIREILRHDGAVIVVGDVSESDQDFLSFVSRPAEVVLVDRDLDHRDGISLATNMLDELGPKAPLVIMVADTYRPGDIARAARAGVRGVLIKDQETWTLGAAVRAVAAGKAWLSPSVAGDLLDVFRGAQADEEVKSPLTERELDVVRLVALGFSNTEIAGELTVSESTVKSHISRMLAKLDLRSRTQLAAFARDHGLV